MSFKAVAVLVLALAFAGSSFLVPFGGFDPGQFPVPREDPPVQPAGYAFAIWGLIYLWLIAMGLNGVWRRRTDEAWDRTRWPLILSLGVGMFWLPVASRSAEWATVLIWIMLAGALLSLMRAPRRDMWTLGAPLGLYAGWLTAASSVSIGLIGAGYGIVSQTVAAVMAVVVAVAIAVVLTSRVAPALPYAAAVIWALVALVVKNAGDATLVAGLAATGVIVMGVALWQARVAGAAG